MSQRGSRCQSAVGSRSQSAVPSPAGSRCGSRRSSRLDVNKGNNGSGRTSCRPKTSRSQCNTPKVQQYQQVSNGCRPGCTACCPAPTRRPPCPEGVYVERVKSLKPAIEFVPSCAKFDGVSTYREFFYPKCGERVKSFKPASYMDPSCAKFDGLTTYREFYYPKCAGKAQSFKPASQFDPSCAKMDGISTYRNDYFGRQAERVKSLKPATQFDPSCAKMDGLTTYRQCYIPYCPRESGKLDSTKRIAVVDFSCAPFDGMTTYRETFWPKPIVRVQSLKPTVRGAFSDSPFADRTTYRNDYNPFHFNKNCGECVAPSYCQVPVIQPCCMGVEQQSQPIEVTLGGNADGCGDGSAKQAPSISPKGSSSQISQGNFDGMKGNGGTIREQCYMPDVVPETCPTVDTTETRMDGDEQ